MACLCANLSTVEKVAANTAFFNALQTLEQGNWVCLGQCSQCKQLWAVALWDKYQTQLATKIAVAERSTWQEANIAAEKIFLIESRGGLTEKLCVWAACTKLCVQGVAYCVDHLYAHGARE